MTITQTVTIPAQDHVAKHVVIRIGSKNQTEAFLDHLATIIETIGNEMHAKWKDPLSYNLLEWGTNVLVETQGQNFEDLLQGDFREAIRDQIDVLIHKIMVDFIEKSPLRNPVLIAETGWTCERYYVELSNMNIGGKPVTMVAHNFAIAMLKWTASLFVEPSAEMGMNEDPNDPNNQNDPNIQNVIIPVALSQDKIYQDADIESIVRSFGLSYRMKASQAATIQKIRGLTQVIQEESEEFQWLKGVIEERRARRIEEEMKMAAENNQKLNQKIDQLERINQEKIEVLSERATVAEKKLDVAEAKVIELKIETVRQQSQIGSLRNEIYHRQQELEAVRRRARDQERRDRNGCTIL